MARNVVCPFGFPFKTYRTGGALKKDTPFGTLKIVGSNVREAATKGGGQDFARMGSSRGIGVVFFG